jgi:hypothetical protein
METGWDEVCGGAWILTMRGRPWFRERTPDGMITWTLIDKQEIVVKGRYFNFKGSQRVWVEKRWRRRFLELERAYRLKVRPPRSSGVRIGGRDPERGVCFEVKLPQNPRWGRLVFVMYLGIAWKTWLVKPAQLLRLADYIKKRCEELLPHGRRTERPPLSHGRCAEGDPS